MQTHKGEKSICLPNNNYKCAKLASTLQKQELSSCEDANSTFHHVIDVVDDSPKKGHLSRTQSSHDQCRVCQQDKEEVLINLGCKCKGGLSQAHRSCIDAWFRTRGSNKCEICQEVAVNVPPPPETQPSTNYWVWRTDPTLRSRDPERGCFSPLWVAFSILVGGLLLDVLISITLGVSALPVNIIIVDAGVTDGCSRFLNIISPYIFLLSKERKLWCHCRAWAWNST
ncbi:uncharacterized protein LOC126679234 isoform X2 [Mercurialis annua]|uniref:uncharacterized protein LOC126679234 isoform X2 n=1 Tax=Mercurialis annua TaxID=3986 RepID=UPI0024AF94D9|nr:uncharacterized protein LOC126679234 isoform X2 [Mercurialis annua]